MLMYVGEIRGWVELVDQTAVTNTCVGGGYAKVTSYHASHGHGSIVIPKETNRFSGFWFLVLVLVMQPCREVMSDGPWGQHMIDRHGNNIRICTK